MQTAIADWFSMFKASWEMAMIATLCMQTVPKTWLTLEVSELFFALNAAST